MEQRTEVECCEFLHVHQELVNDLRASIPKDEMLCDLADFFKVFADSTRIRILCVLKDHELCVCDIANILNMTQSAISHQLRLLKSMRLVKNRKEGKTVFYALADDHIHTIIAQGMEHIGEED